MSISPLFIEAAYSVAPSRIAASTAVLSVGAEWIMLFGLLLLIGSDLLIAGLSIPLMRRRVPPNELYGLRVASTFADEHVWYEANAASARDLLLFAIGHIALTLLAALIPKIPENTFILGSIAVLLIGVITIAIVGWKRANRMLEERKGLEGFPS